MTARSSVLSGQGFKGMPDLSVKQLSRKSSCLMCYAGGDVSFCSHGDCQTKSRIIKKNQSNEWN